MNNKQKLYWLNSIHIKAKKLFYVEEVKHPKIIAIAAFIGCLLLNFIVVYQQYQLAENKLTRKMEEELIVVKDKLNAILNSSFLATKRLAYIVENYGEPQDFQKIGEHFISNNKNIDALELTKDGVITHVYPLKGNENVIGYDILNDSNTRKEAIKAITDKDLYFAGPFHLKQGGKGIVGRYPITINQKFWGFAVVVVKLETLIKNIGIDHPNNEKFYYQLAKKNPNSGEVEYFLNNQFPLKHSHTKTFYIPAGQWTIYLHSKENAFGLNLLLLSFLGGIFSFLIAFLTWRISNQPFILHQLVQEKTAQIIQTENLLSTSLDRTKDSFISLDNEWRYTFLNQASMSTHPASREEILGKTIWEVHPELIGTEFETEYRKCMETKEAGFIESYYEPMKKYFSGKIYPSHSGITIIYEDITEKKLIEKELNENYQNIRKLNNHLNSVREDERTNIAREIHDELGQQLTALKMDTHWINKKINTSDGNIIQKIQEMLHIIDKTIVTVRRISSDLRPGILDDLGIVAALEWQSFEIQKRSGIPIKFKSDITQLQLDKNIAIGIFRIYQEALTNILRYAETPSVISNLDLIHDYLLLRIQDFGKGFDFEEVKNKNTFGLSSMRERAIMMHGNLVIESSPNQGTIIQLHIPLTKT